MKNSSTNVSPSKHASATQQTGTNRQFEARHHSDAPTLHPSEYNGCQSSSNPHMSCARADVMESIIIRRLSNGEDITEGHPAMYPSLFQKVHPDKANSRSHAILHNGNSSIGTLHSIRSASHQHDLHHRSCSNLGYAHPPSHESSFRSSPLHFDPPHYELERDCLHHTINENSNQTFSISKPNQNEANPLSQVCSLLPKL